MNEPDDDSNYANMDIEYFFLYVKFEKMLVIVFSVVWKDDSKRKSRIRGITAKPHEIFKIKNLVISKKFR